VFARLGRTTAPLAALSLLLIPALAACSSNGGDSDSSSSPAANVSSVGTGTGKAGWGGVSITGDFGKAPQVKFNSAVATPSKTLQKTLVAGKGAAITSGEQLNIDIWLGDGTSQKKVYSDWDNGAPEAFTDTAADGTFWTGLLTGAKIGSRIAAITNATNVVGSSGNQSLGIGAGDSLVVVVDIVSKVKPVVPKDVSPSALPKVLTKGAKVTGLSWTGIKKPSANPPFERVVLKKGTGPVVKADSTITANYYGSLYGKAKPFQTSYTGTPITDPLSGLIAGWRDGLVGLHAGSRVLLQIPSSLGYQNSKQPGIPANSTLYFVLDITKVK